MEQARGALLCVAGDAEDDDVEQQLEESGADRVDDGGDHQADVWVEGEELAAERQEEEAEEDHEVSERHERSGPMLVGRF